MAQSAPQGDLATPLIVIGSVENAVFAFICKKKYRPIWWRRVSFSKLAKTNLFFDMALSKRVENAIVFEPRWRAHSQLLAEVHQKSRSSGHRDLRAN